MNVDGFVHRYRKTEYKVLPFILCLESTLFERSATLDDTCATKRNSANHLPYQKHLSYEEAFVFSTEESTDAQLSAMEELIRITWPRLLAGEDSKFILASSETPPT